ncbi:CRISPR-associated protein Cas5 [Clostridium estertheticum]|uniref:CRISPR-associated protein Cas5 n=1 Tax=Clostridium estertheticum TaxID=238834 RepID=UPI001C7DB3F1|nr:CRISPR-associated protein Cas5 [Clostridium estertheticum]MBX4262154.1 CRISPR-associated protein Cas5 [Clostridium estertheticum]WLC69023.1 CRISPR-associated protein Cas5 [Clostridium estertheticum]
MEVLRIILTQSSANYKKEETVLNKMTYPLPPFSTIIGALHSACGYKEYHPMDISIQGKYEAMHKEPYTDYCFLNSTMNDRGILVRMKNENLLSTAFDKVAKAKASTGNNFRKGTTIEVLNGRLLEEYRALKDLTEKIAEFKINRIDKVLELTKKRKKTLMDKKKKYKEDLQEFQLISKREKEIKELEKTVKERFKDYKKKEYEIPYSRFASLTTSLKYYEVLNNIKLILHIKSDRNTLDEIKDNIYNLKSIGRSEDFVDVREACFVDVVDEIDDEDEIISEYSAYISYELIKNEHINLRSKKGTSADGTKYYLNKNYIIEDNKRIFEKKKVVYTSDYAAEEGSDNLYFDIGKEKSYIVNFN